jgi:DNA-binding SARP family transcriptional activator
MAPASLDFRLLGPFEVFVDGREQTPSRPKQRALLALLLLRPNEVVASDELVEALWGERPPETAPTALHGHVSALRKLYGAEAIETHPPGYLLRVMDEQSDVGRFQRLVDQARGAADPARRAELLRTALELFRGDPLSEFRYEPFAREEIVRLEDRRLAATEERIQADLELGRHASLVAELERLAASHPHRERLRGQLMLALYRSGRQAEALHAYQEGRQLLAEELGLDPGPSLQELERQILRHDPTLAPPASGAPEPARARRERKLVTVLFCDLVGFTARSEELDPEEVQALLEPYFVRVRAELERFGGTVEKFIGDAVMGVFGAPVAHEDDPERAVRAALAIRDALAGELDLRIAVHTGEALVTLDADPRAGQGIVAGDVVNTASRLQSAAPPGSVIVGEATRRATERAIEYRELEPVVARGKREPVSVWEAVAAGPRGERREARTPFVGRDSELSQLRDTLVRARERREPQLVTILGVPGIGKTRLLRELYVLVEAAAESVVWLVGRSLAYGEGVTFWALGEIVKSQAGIYEGDPAPEVEEKLRLTVGEAVDDPSEAEWVLRHLRPLVGLGTEAEITAAREGEAFAAWSRFFEGLADQVPIVVVFEDLHWADEGLLDFLDHLAERLRDLPLVVIGTARPELLSRRPGWGGGKANATTISLSPLSDENTARLLAALLEHTVLPAETQQLLLARAGGNPLYTEQYARMVVERGGAELALPETVQGVIAARLDALSQEEKELLQSASVVGQVFWSGALGAIGGGSPPQLEDRLHALERKEFVRRRRRSSVEGESEHAFLHVLVRDVAYGQIPRAGRAEKHRLAAEWIESLSADRSEDRAEMLAHHYGSALEYARASGSELGDLSERTRFALREAGDRAAALSAFASAARFYEAALELWPTDDSERPHLLLGYGRVLRVAGATGVEVLTEARDGLLELGDVEAAAEAELLLSTLVWGQGRHDLAQAHLNGAALLVRDAATTPTKARVLSHVSGFHMISGESEEAVRVGREALAMAEELGLDELRAHALNNIGTARTNLGDTGGVADLERSIEIALSVKSEESLRAYNNLANVLTTLGELTRGRQLYTEAQRLAEHSGNGRFARRSRSILGLYRFWAGDWDQALQLVGEVIEETAQSPNNLEWLCRRVRAHIRLGRGDLTGGLDDATRGVGGARGVSEPQALCPTLACYARALVAVDRADTAAEAADEALQIATAGGYSPRWEWADLAVVCAEVGRTGDLLDALEAAAATRWVEASKLYTTGDFGAAADVYAGMGALPEEAQARMKAAESLLADGRRQEGEAALESALDFYRSVGASRYVDMGAALLAASA